MRIIICKIIILGTSYLSNHKFFSSSLYYNLLAIFVLADLSTLTSEIVWACQVRADVDPIYGRHLGFFIFHISDSISVDSKFSYLKIY